MSRDFPGLVDLWRLVERRRGYSGTWPLTRCTRLKTSLHSDEGDVAFEIDFGTDDLGVRFADLSVNTKLTLLCQRSLEPFLFQIERKTRLGLIENEEDEASLPAGYEPYIVPAQPLELVDLIEDELILALPVVPLGPQGPLDASFGPVGADLDQAEAEQSGPFAVLAGLKTKNLDKY